MQVEVIQGKLKKDRVTAQRAENLLEPVAGTQSLLNPHGTAAPAGNSPSGVQVNCASLVHWRRDPGGNWSRAQAPGLKEYVPQGGIADWLERKPGLFKGKC